MFDIQQYIDIQYVTEERKNRRKGSKSTQEFFTPYEIVEKMCDKIDEAVWSDPTKTFCEPCFGNGNFILMILYNRLQHGIDWRTALKTCRGIELMADNVAETKARVCGMLSQLCEDFDEEEARRIMDKNFMCHDFFTWDFENWKPLEIKEKKKKLKTKE